MPDDNYSLAEREIGSCIEHLGVLLRDPSFTLMQRYALAKSEQDFRTALARLIQERKASAAMHWRIEMEPVGLPSEETATCPRCHKQAAVIDRTVTTVTTACLNCGETRRVTR
jgi:hypothetical protein